MAMKDMKIMPHLVKPFALLLIILQTIFVFAPGYRSFQWFVSLTTIIELIVCIGVFGMLAIDLDLLFVKSTWPMTEMSYSGVFAIFQFIIFFYFLLNMFAHFNFFLLFGVSVSAALGFLWLVNSFLWFRKRTTRPTPSTANPMSTATTHTYGVNQA